MAASAAFVVVYDSVAAVKVVERRFSRIFFHPGASGRVVEKGRACRPAEMAGDRALQVPHDAEQIAVHRVESGVFVAQERGGVAVETVKSHHRVGQVAGTRRETKAADKVFRVIEKVVDAGTLRVVTRFGSQFMPVFRIGRTVAEPIGIENGTELETEVGTVAECRYRGEAESRFPIGIFRACEGAAGWGGHTVGTAGFGTGTACSGSQQDCRCEQQFHDRLVSSFSRHPSVGLRP